MADKTNPPVKRVKFLFLDGVLHRVIHVSRSEDLIVTWDYKSKECRTYLWSDVKRKMQRAYTLSESARLLGRHPDRLRRYIRSGDIHAPTPAPLPGHEKHDQTRLFYSEDDLLALHEFFLTIHRGRPRKDGRITPGRLPNRQELRTLVQGGKMLYTKDEGGEFVPVWKEDIW